MIESSLWCHTTLVTLTQTATESSLTSAESPLDGLERDNYKFSPKFSACPAAYLVNPRTAMIVHHTHKHALRRWITNYLMWDDIFWIRTNGVLPPFCSSTPTKQFKVLRVYFQWVQCAFTGSGVKVNEFNTVSSTPATVGTARGGGCTGLQQHADEGAAVKESVTAPWRWRSAGARFVCGATEREAGEMSWNHWTNCLKSDDLSRILCFSDEKLFMKYLFQFL